MPKCAVCASEGEVLYAGQRDRLFGAEGTWTLKRCSNRQCRLLWLDPMPRQEEIWKAYANYYTHAPQSGTNGAGGLKGVYRRIKRGYWADKYGYACNGSSYGKKALGKLLYLLPLRRSGADVEVRFLDAAPGGRLLDVGCGSGDWLLLMRELGWQVEGVDFDEAAVKVAWERGIAVKSGAIEHQGYASESFDAVTLSHVIEHVPDPLATLVECRRVLKPSGRLVLFTPNGNSLGHRLFRSEWRGLEPPRHLHVLSPGAMLALLAKAGFGSAKVGTYNSKYVWEQSYSLWRQGKGNPSGSADGGLSKLAIELLTWYEQLLLGINSSAGECIWATAKRA